VIITLDGPATAAYMLGVDGWFVVIPDGLYVQFCALRLVKTANPPTAINSDPVHVTELNVLNGKFSLSACVMYRCYPDRYK
jgi:hypothetical protein